MRHTVLLSEQIRGSRKQACYGAAPTGCFQTLLFEHFNAAVALGASKTFTEKPFLFVAKEAPGFRPRDPLSLY